MSESSGNQINESPRVSVLIAVKKEGTRLERCLEAVSAALDAAPWPAEVIVAAAGSADLSTVETLGAADDRFRVVQNPAKSAAAGLNLAFEHSRGDILVRIDARTIVAADYLVAAVQVLEREGAECVGGHQLPRGKGAIGNAVALLSGSPLGSGGARYRRQARTDDRETCHEADTVYLGAWPRHVFEKLGGFDESLPRNQDEEFAFRIRRHGGRVLLSTRLRSHYETRESLGAVAKQYFRFGLHKPRVLWRHPGEIRWRHLLPSIVLVGGIFLLVGSRWWPPLLALAVLVGLVWLIAHLGLALLRPGAFGFGARLLAPLVAFTQQVAYGIGFAIGLGRLRGDKTPRVPETSLAGETERLRDLYRARDRRFADHYGPEPATVRAERRRRREAILRAVASQSISLGELSILEIGCGRGDFSSDLLALGIIPAKITGIDLLPERLRHLANTLEISRLAVASGAAMPFRPASFDLVVLATVLSSLRHGRMRVRTLEEVDRVLNPGGWVLVYDLLPSLPGRDWQPLDPEELRRLWGPPRFEERFAPIAGLRAWAGRVSGPSHGLFLFRKDS